MSGADSMGDGGGAGGYGPPDPVKASHKKDGRLMFHVSWSLTPLTILDSLLNVQYLAEHKSDVFTSPIPFLQIDLYNRSNFAFFVLVYLL